MLLQVGAKHPSIVEAEWFDSRINTMNGTSSIFPAPNLLRFAIHDIKHSTTPVELLHSVRDLLRFHHDDTNHIILSATPFLIIALLTLIVYKFLIYPIYLSPLSVIPSAHPLAAITSLWMDYRRLTGKEVSTTYAAFQKYGPFVRLGPNEVRAQCTNMLDKH